MKIPKGGIAFFDSGIGGLTVLKECAKALPKEIFYYYGDNKRAPYGNLSTEKIQKYVLDAFLRFEGYGVKAAVLACNTATAVCVDSLRKRFSFPIVGAEPAVLSGMTMGGEVFVLSTRATAESERFRLLCLRASKRFSLAHICVCPCDDLAGEIERNIGNKDYDYTPFLPRGKPTAVVLGCTHYVYIAEQIARFYGCKVVDGNRGISLRLQAVLRKKEELAATLDHFQPPSLKNTLKTGVFTAKSPMILLDNGSGIFFLGGGKVVNKTIYEQMFV